MKKLFLLINIILLLCSCTTSPFSYNASKINVLKDNSKQFDFNIHSSGYMLVDMSDFEILYKKNNDVAIFPASLTKVLTLDTVLHYVEDLNEESYVTYSQVADLISQDASLAHLKTGQNYTIEDLLYALILPSGADAAVALENYFKYLDLDLVEQMNILAKQLGCKNSNFVNTTGLHDDNHYTSIDDLFLILMDTLKYETGREILTSTSHTLSDGLFVDTGIRMLKRFNYAQILGGKTGYTQESGQSIMLLYRHYGKPYVLFTLNAMGSYAKNQYWHYEDVLTIFEHLY